ncbi:unnamed protein product [Ectocarpus sp. 8 AP-2014]
MPFFDGLVAWADRTLLDQLGMCYPCADMVLRSRAASSLGCLYLELSIDAVFRHGDTPGLSLGVLPPHPVLVGFTPTRPCFVRFVCVSSLGQQGIKGKQATKFLSD